MTCGEGHVTCGEGHVTCGDGHVTYVREGKGMSTSGSTLSY